MFWRKAAIVLVPDIITDLNSFTYDLHWTVTGISFSDVLPKLLQQHLQIIFRQNSHKNKAQNFKAVKASEKPFFENCISMKLKKYLPPKQNKQNPPPVIHLIHPILIFNTSKK